MFVPLHDDNQLKSIPFQFVTVTLIAINVVVYLLEATQLDAAAIASFAVVPRELLPATLAGPLLVDSGVPNDSINVPEFLTPLTYMFFHGDFLHLAGNMLFLWVFGDNVEDAMGHFKFLIFYLACGILAAFVHSLVTPGSDSPLIGASGAVAGVIAAYLMLHPKVSIWVLAFKFLPLRVSALIALGAWILLQVVMAVMPQMGPVAWWAHIGGLLAGAVLVIFMRRPGVPLFDKGLHVSA